MSKKKNKVILASSLSAIIGASALVPVISVSAESSFPDISADHPYFDVISQLANEGVVTGFPSGEFKMGESMTRAQAAQIIVELTNLDTENVPNTPFSDVKENVWYTGAINALYHKGSIKGYTDGTFRPNEKITRAEFAQLIIGAFDIPLKKGDTPFNDLVDGAWYEEGVEALFAHDLIVGQSDNTFGPSANMKRGDGIFLLSNTRDAFEVSKNFQLTIMHTNDTHANLDNIPKTVTAVNEIRTEKPDSLLLHAGDVFSGTLYFNEFQGQADLELLNLMSFDAMTFGNHEFDLGSSEEGHQALADFVAGAHFPFVSANVDFSKDDKFKGLFSDLISRDPQNGEIYNGIIKEIDGEKVGIFGLTTAETKDISSPGNIEFSDYLEEAEKAVAAFEGQGVNKIIALTHIGFDDNAEIDNDQVLAASVAGIDVVVGGHSHTQLDEPVVIAMDENGEAKDPTLIVQAYQYNNFLGTLDVEFDDNGVVVGHAGKLIEIGEQEEDKEALEALKPYQDRVNEVSKAEIGVTLTETLETPRTSGDNTLPSIRKNETILGNIITDGMLLKAKEYNEGVIMAFQNGGGIRAGIEAGPITVGEVITVLPFGNTLATMEVSGAELKEAFEHSLRAFPAESGGFLHIAGGKVEFDPSKPAGERVVSIFYENSNGTFTEIEAGKMYTVATNAFTAKGGDGYDVFAKAYEDNRVTDLGLSDWENLQEQLVRLGSDGIPTKIEGRILDVTDPNYEKPVDGNTNPGTPPKKNTPDPGGEESTPEPEELPGGEIVASDFSGEVEAPKVYNSDVTVDATNVSTFENVTVKGNLILTGTLKSDAIFKNIIVEGHLDISNLDTDISNFNDVTVHGDTIL